MFGCFEAISYISAEGRSSYGSCLGHIVIHQHQQIELYNVGFLHCLNLCDGIRLWSSVNFYPLTTLIFCHHLQIPIGLLLLYQNFMVEGLFTCPAMLSSSYAPSLVERHVISSCSSFSDFLLAVRAWLR